jgi:membrane protease YdiL (CAAX protease family)
MATEPTDIPTRFARRRHLLFAAAALFTHAALTRADWRPAEQLGASWPWDAADVLLFRSIPLLAVAVFAWLAFAAFDTRSGVTLIARRWWKVGWEPWAVMIVVATWYIAASVHGSPESTAAMAQKYLSPFHDAALGSIAWDWLVTSIVVGALTEELIFRGLLQRALEGYLPERCAVVAQALVFELVHLYVYGIEFTGGHHLLTGLAFGVAFKRTRSLAGPVVLHSVGNLVHALAFSTAL